MLLQGSGVQGHLCKRQAARTYTWRPTTRAEQCKPEVCAWQKQGIPGAYKVMPWRPWSRWRPWRSWSSWRPWGASFFSRQQANVAGLQYYMQLTNGTWPSTHASCQHTGRTGIPAGQWKGALVTTWNAAGKVRPWRPWACNWNPWCVRPKMPGRSCMGRPGLHEPSRHAAAHVQPGHSWQRLLACTAILAMTESIHGNPGSVQGCFLSHPGRTCCQPPRPTTWTLAARQSGFACSAGYADPSKGPSKALPCFKVPTA